ncbi:MAG: TIM barrel protein [Clostridia bacterium]|nr:TIM barrel protein [Clostridia bacterium]
MIKFGPSGNSVAFADAGNSKSEQSAKWVKDLGLDCFEYSFGRGVNMGDERAIEIGNAFKEQGVEISVHAPYYINFANPEEENAEKSYAYVIQSAEKLKLLGGKRVVFHPASQGKMKREQAVALTKERLKTLRDRIYEKGLDDLIYCPETMGKIGQIGTIEEVVEFCKIDKIYIPAVDFGHINARECGSLKSEKDYYDRLEYMLSELGYEKMKHFHIHFSKIEYSAKGEVRHLTFEDDHYGPEFEPLSVVLKKLKLEPFVICESAGTQDIDAVKMQKLYYGN